jgi:penicillin-binding protein 1A
MKKIIIAVLVLVLAAACGIGFYLFSALSSLPNVATLKHYRPAAAAEVLDKDGIVVTQFYDRKFRIWVPIQGLPDIVIRAVVTAEDDTFFEHHGVNYKATWDALVLDVQKHRYARGGSTITQQMIKNVFLSKEKTITRKLREYVLAGKAERILTKRQILEIYLNEVEWGENIYGIEAASRYYLDKHASELTVGEAALLAGMLPNPRYYNPAKRPEKAKTRQKRVLFNLQQAKLISQDEYQTALDAPFALRKEGAGTFDFTALTGEAGRPCYQRVLEQVLERLYGEQALYRGGLTIRTTIDKKLQDAFARLTSSGTAATVTPNTVTVLEQEGKIRAIACGTIQDDELHSRLETPITNAAQYTVRTQTVESLSQEQILLAPAP